MSGGKWRPTATAATYGDCWARLLAVPAAPGAAEMIVRPEGRRP